MRDLFANLKLHVLRASILTVRRLGKWWLSKLLAVGVWIRSSPRLILIGRRAIIELYAGLLRLRAAARAMHPRAHLHILLTHPVSLRAILVILFAAVVMNNLKTRGLPSDELGQKSIIYKLIVSEAGALIVETAPSYSAMPPSLGVLVIRRDAAMEAEDDGRETLPLAAGTGALVRPNPAETLRGSRPRDTIITYTVQQHDTLSDIAYRFTLSVQTLVWANNLSLRSIIRPGDNLIIPQVDGTVHRVARGDTLARIAARYRASVPNIIAVNNITDSETLVPGTLLTIPGGTPPRVLAAAPRRAVIRAPAQPIRPTRSGRGGGGLIWPTTGRLITQYFSWRHAGIDIDGNLSSPIFAAADGTVEIARAGWNGGYGTVIIINHGLGVQTRYAHLSRLLVKPGDKVKAGEVIGIMGSTGRSTGSHLHFEVIMGGVKKNPLSYL